MLGHGSTLEEAAIGVTVRALRVVANRIESESQGGRGNYLDSERRRVDWEALLAHPRTIKESAPINMRYGVE